MANKGSGSEFMFAPPLSNAGCVADPFLVSKEAALKTKTFSVDQHFSYFTL